MAIDYLSEYSEKYHHPKEDILYHYYREHYGAHDDMDNLEFEHKLLECKTHAFMNIVEMILQDAVVPHHLFIEQLEAFMNAQKSHLELEEKNILPMICDRFSVEDWQHVETLYSGSDDDPVFGDTIPTYLIRYPYQAVLFLSDDDLELPLFLAIYV